MTLSRLPDGQSRPGTRGILLAAVVLGAALWAVAPWHGTAIQGRCYAQASSASNVRLAGQASSQRYLLRADTPCGKFNSMLSRALSTNSEEDTWKEAWQLEMQRNRLLREQIESRGLTHLLLESDNIAEADGAADACEVDWASSYDKLAACNGVLQAKLSSGGTSANFEDMRDVAAKTPGVFQVVLPKKQGGTQLSIELLNFFGKGAAFYSVRAALPLGLNLTKRTRGALQGAFVVEDVLAGGSAEAGGQILQGDVLHAVSAVNDGTTQGMQMEDFVSTVVGNINRYKQNMVDTSFINTLEDLVQAFKSNLLLGSDVQLTLIFERDTLSAPVPLKVLEPVDPNKWANAFARKAQP
eukprot:CAMPEP_0115107370 /NCGR_PEP_ID=MMETSP0227-20121206/37272_1 /TAXON_ID=89957 /ORGANISM="Polarella glacialis, Strain CCMP 1383" /LENGTH=354 /DNA_ID=CAMNT_0002505269 /DNA_START=37 /DNA_END=1101 /DNA_ORIENTATION=+